VCINVTLLINDQIRNQEKNMLKVIAKYNTVQVFMCTAIVIVN